MNKSEALKETVANVEKITKQKIASDKDMSEKTSTDLSKRYVDEARTIGIKSSNLEKQIDDISIDLSQRLKVLFNRDSSNIVKNLNETFEKTEEGKIGSLRNQEEVNKYISQFVKEFFEQANRKIYRILENNVRPAIIESTMTKIKRFSENLSQDTITKLQEYSDSSSKMFIELLENECKTYNLKLKEEVEKDIKEDNKKTEYDAHDEI